MTIRWNRLAATAAAILIAGQAAAHHPLGGATPATFGQGLLSGVGHPMLGIDHFAFIVAMGLMAAMIGRPLLAPVAFVVASALGTLLTVGGVALPMVELVVSGSAVAAGALVLSGRRLPLAGALALFAGVGLFHGWAFGQAVVGAESTPILAYLIGLALTQWAIAAGVALFARMVWREAGQGALATRLTGAVMAGLGAAFLFEALEKMAFGPLA
jgi:urease accessory protein